jgi:hypothetical protein
VGSTCSESNSTSRQPRAPHRPFPIQTTRAAEQATQGLKRTHAGGSRQCNAPRSYARSSGPLYSRRVLSPRGVAAASVEAFA